MAATETARQNFIATWALDVNLQYPSRPELGPINLVLEINLR